MSATIGAALKKIAVSLLTDKKVIKTIGGIVLGIIIIVVMPIVAVVSIFNGSMDIDTDKLNQSIQENISAEQMENLQLINDTMTEVEKQLDKKELSDCNTQAEVIYLFSLSDKSEDKDFVKSFVSCFKKNQSDEDLIKAVNQKFGTEIKYDEFQKMMQSIKGAEISTAALTDKTTKNNLDQQATLFPCNNEAGGEMRQVGEKWLGKRVCDCIGLIKSYAWYNADSGEIVAGSNGFTDCGANSIWSNVTESGPISNMPNTPGLAVWMDGHIGVYIGNGEVIEAQGTAYGVVKTELNGRGWTKWLKIPNIKYMEVKSK
ncbi:MULTISPECIES: NlpC/P60 family protein [Ruminococcus]|uniref:NlpC/P60 family protein n=1 Tax=Ruminococcus TaxID=1263 RepID=UPI0025D3D719|nr:MULTISPECIES: NlpC/P60 family protein [Ruminococcus]